jgi:hypothetical protein
MTLVLTCFTDDCVYQVSDRRLTSFLPPHSAIDDEANKAVLVDGRVAFGYSGRSDINGQRTDLWLTKTLTSVGGGDMGAYTRRLTDEATREFSAMRVADRFKRHAFQGVGWFTDPAHPSRLRPGAVIVENALDAHGGWLPRARSAFRCSTAFRSPPFNRSQFALTAIGNKPHPGDFHFVWRLLQKCVQRRSRREDAVLNAMVGAMRWFHFRTGPYSPIGPNLMAVILPRMAAERTAQTGQMFALSSGPLPNVATFLDINTSGRTERYGPHFVMGGGAATNFTVVPIR